jgi:hypothetical protein
MLPMRSARLGPTDIFIQFLHKASFRAAGSSIMPSIHRARGERRFPDVGVAQRALFCTRRGPCVFFFRWQFEVWLVEGGHRKKELEIKADPDRIVADLSASLRFLLPGGRWQR